ncbi:uncharacterized protein LOC131620102 [Vicia villosa]|uniref:uncharacterized protein LOC131620102 n=1 Tax=Vicia villosa TaxID=3911 RepID=UPI00273BC79B|nr:uncharacterized protein LOC131620102 [Vicia villosa]
MFIDVAAGGALMNKPYPDACALIEDMAQNHAQWGIERAAVEKKESRGGKHEISCMDMMNAKMDALALRVENMSQNPTTMAGIQSECELCGTQGHQTIDWPRNPNLSTPEKPKEDAAPKDQVEEPEKPEKQSKPEVGNHTQQPYKPPIPFPQRLKNTKIENQFQKFIKVIEKLHVEIPFTEAITHIPSYAKFLKDILSNKQRLDDPKPLECHSISKNKLAKKDKDPRSFSIPCILGNHMIDKAFLDLGASVSLMPLVVCKRLKLGELQPTKMSLQLADRSVKYPMGILEDIPVKIGQLYIPIDFVVMDIKEDDDILILLGRPFLSTAWAIIDVKKGKLTFEVGDEKIEFILSKFLMAPVIGDACYAIDVIDECVNELEHNESLIRLPSTPILEDDRFKSIEPYIDDNLFECLALTPDPMPCTKKPAIELKELPKNLRYDFLDEEMNRPVIISATLNQIETNQLLDTLRKYP